MTREEWNEWHADLMRKLPEAGVYIQQLPATTRDEWFDGIFSLFELRDAKAVTMRCFEEGLLSKWERDRLPSIFRNALLDQAAKRIKKENEMRRRFSSGAQQRVLQDAQMGPAYRHLVSEMRRYREEHNGEAMPDWMITMRNDEWWEKNT